METCGGHIDHHQIEEGIHRYYNYRSYSSTIFGDQFMSRVRNSISITETLQGVDDHSV